jgi:beta-glucosidase-like glycosyl hydrolase
MTPIVKNHLAQLLISAVSWDTATGYAGARSRIDAALALGVGGFILRGGEREAVRALTKDLRQRSRVPLLIAADMERGAGEQFIGATGLPPLGAIASLGDVDAVRRAARLTAREARTMGVNWDFAPVCDLDLDADNPIIGSRAFGADPARASEYAVEWIAACQSEGVLACAKHFPGHGRTVADSHCVLPVVSASSAEMMDVDLAPFRAAIGAGVASLMTAHVAYPALDASGAPATLSREILHWLLRQRLKFDGLVVSDAVTMAGVLQGRSESEAVVAAVRAGCDLVLGPSDLTETLAALDRAMQERGLDEEKIRQSLRRRLKWAQWASPPNAYRKPSMSDTAWGAQLAERVIGVARGKVPALAPPVDVIVVDDDPGTVDRGAFPDTLRGGGWDVRVVEAPTPTVRSPLVIALFGDARAWKGRAGYAPATREAVAALTARAAAAHREALVVQFSHPRLADEIPEAQHIVTAWCGDRAMQCAAARWLRRQG